MIEQVNDPAGRYYTDDTGVRAPSVTTILGSVFGEDGKYIREKVIPEACAITYDLRDETKSVAISEAVASWGMKMSSAAEVGSRVHDLIWQENPDLSNDDPRVLTCMESWDLFKKDNDIRLISDEQMLLGKSRYGPFGGTYDALVVLNGRRRLMELKTSWKLGPSHALQTAAYAKAMGEEECFVLRLGKYKVDWEIQIPRDDAWTLFEAAHGLYVHMGDSIWRQSSR